MHVVISRKAWQASVLANDWSAKDLWEVVEPNVLGARTAGRCNTAHCARQSIFLLNEHVNITHEMLAMSGQYKDKKRAKKSGLAPVLCGNRPTRYWNCGAPPHIGTVGGCADALLEIVGNEQN
jgi:hypothetical protein